MSKAYSEDQLVQKTIADYFHDHLEWDSVYAYNEETLGRAKGLLGRESHREVVLVRYLRLALERLNPNLPYEAYELAIEQVVSASSAKTTIQNNLDKHHLNLSGLTVDVKTGTGELETHRLKLFDFDDAANNHFLVVRELWVQGQIYHRRADIVGFVNGIPLLFMECKAAHKDLRLAFNANLKDYKDTIPELFHHNAIVFLSNGMEGKAGTITSRFDHFHEWKRLEETDLGRVDMETMLLGMCTKKAFLDLVENFILFDTSGTKTVKLLARNHQFLGVNRALEAVQQREARLGKLGVFWHTQGSGKSYSMVFLAQKILRKLGANFTFLVLTDRQELDTQIYKTFHAVGAVKSKKVQASSGEHLRQLLEQENHRYVFSLIHKFNEENPESYSTRNDIIVFSDEAHRSQYGKLARNMRKALPAASFIGFTGTPLMGSPEDELTREVFGDYVSTYDFQRAVEDKATVPLFYESRGDKLGIAKPDLNQTIAEKLNELELDPDQDAKLQRALAREYPIMTAPKRLRAIAKDFVEHYTTNWKTGKAMLVCLDKLTCVRMFDLIEGEWTGQIREQEIKVSAARDEQELLDEQRKLDWLKETQRLVVVSEEQNEVDTFRREGMEIEPHRKCMKDGLTDADGKIVDLETAFKDGDHPFRVAIVCAMWLTGFDVPSLATLYIDKPMKGHTLMQTIARANRVSEGKDNGTVVDYNGILRSLRQALATYANGHGEGGGEGGGIDPVKPREEQVADFAESIHACRDHLASLDFDLDTLINATGFGKLQKLKAAEDAVYLNDESKAKFEVLARDVFRKVKPLTSEPAIRPLWPHHDAIEAIYKRIQDNREAADIADILRDLRAIVDDAIVVQEDRATENQPSEPYDISQIDFERLRKEFEHSNRKNTMIQCLKTRIEQVLQKMVQQNPKRIDFYKRYQEIVEAYNKEKDRSTIERTFEELMKLVGSLSTEENRAVREHLSEDHLAIFDLLAKDDLKPKERERIKEVAKGLLDALKIQLATMDQWAEKATTKSQVSTFIHDYLFDEQQGLPEVYEIEEVEELSEQVYEFVFQHFGKAS